ncbi:MAG: type II secretion system F family protein [Firmicutes bacterium]|nr:type II secretion system F family protein [Bacillota bacterium]
MVNFKYTAISKSGQKVKGVIEAYNEIDAVDRIKQDCDVVLKINEVKSDKPGFLSMEIGGNKLDAKAFTMMCRQFAIIVSAGIPIARAVHLIAEKTTNKTLKKMLKQVADDVEAGRSLATSFEESSGKLLPPTFVETLRAGEESGNIDKAFDNMAKHCDKQTKMKGKVKSALAYPAFVLVIAVVVVIVLMAKVVPTFTAIFDEYGAVLPLPTRMLIAMSNFFKDWWIVLLIIIAVIILAYKLYGNTENGRLRLAKIALKLPVFGNISELNAASQFSNSMTTMLSAGLPLTKAVSITSKVIDNYFISKEVGKLTGKIEEGYSMGGSMRDSGVFPDILVDMVAVGEETGEMESTLGTISNYYDTELETAIAAAIAKLEPTVLVFLAGVAGFIVIAIYMAMFGMYAAM